MKPDRKSSEAKLAWMRGYYKRTRKKRLAYLHKWQDDNRDYTRQKSKQYYFLHREEKRTYGKRAARHRLPQRKAYTKRWKKENIDRVRELARKWRQRITDEARDSYIVCLLRQQGLPVSAALMGAWRDLLKVKRKLKEMKHGNQNIVRLEQGNE